MRYTNSLSRLALAGALFLTGLSAAEAQDRRAVDIDAVITNLATSEAQAERLRSAVATAEAQRGQAGYLWHVAAAVADQLSAAEVTALTERAQALRTQRVQHIREVARQDGRRGMRVDLNLTEQQRQAIQAAREQHAGDPQAMRAAREQILTPAQRSQMQARAPQRARRADRAGQGQGRAERISQRAGQMPARVAEQQAAMAAALNLTAEQQQVLRATREQARARSAEARRQLREATPEQRRQMREQMQTRTEELRRSLSAEQQQVMQVHRALSTAVMATRTRVDGQRRGR